MCYNSIMIYNLVFPNTNFAHKVDYGPVFEEKFEEHYHLLYEILYLKEGDLKLILENKKYHLAVGDIAFIQPGQHHHVTPRPQGRYERYVLKFPEYLIPDELVEAIKKKPTCSAAGENAIPRLFKEMDWHYENYTGENIQLLMEGLLRTFIVYFCEVGTKGNKTPILYNKKMAEVIDFINENIAKPLKISDICEHFHYSKSYICKEFSKSMDVPIIQYVRTKKILLADSLIKKGLKPTDVCKQCGFSDYSTFFRDYCKVIGNPPSGTNK